LLQTTSILPIFDKSKIKFVKCINVLKGSGAKYAFLNDFLLVAVSNRYLLKKYVKQTMHFAILIGTVSFYRRFSGIYVRMSQNRGILIDSHWSLLSIRILGPIAREVFLSNRFRPFRVRGKTY